MRREHAILGVAIGVLVATALIFWLILDDGGSDDSSEPAGATTAAEVVSVEDLLETAEGREAPIYWAGLPKDAELELSEPEESRVYVRYLTGDAEAGDPRPFLTVGSYEIEDAAMSLRRQGKRSGGVIASAPGGGVVYFSRNDPQSVYLAYPGDDVQVEVFAPSFQQALQLVTSGEITPIAE